VAVAGAIVVALAALVELLVGEVAEAEVLELVLAAQAAEEKLEFIAGKFFERRNQSQNR
jgi:hypothetical protein